MQLQVPNWPKLAMLGPREDQAFVAAGVAEAVASSRSRRPLDVSHGRVAARAFSRALKLKLKGPLRCTAVADWPWARARVVPGPRADFRHVHHAYARAHAARARTYT